MRQLIIILFLVSSLLSCKSSCEDEANIENIRVNVKVDRLEDELFNFKSKEDAAKFVANHSSLCEKYFQKSRFPQDSLLANYLYKFYSNPELRIMYESSKKKFADMSDMRNGLETMLRHVRYYYSDFHVPEINTLVTGFHFDKDILISDSLLIISLDYFLGKEAPYRPEFYEYFLERFDKPFILPMLALGISGKYNEVDLKDETMLANMIYYGKAIYFASQILPCTPDSLVMMYQGKQMEEAEKNENLIWGHFIQKQLLFETKPTLIEKYVGESPRVNEIGPKCPGRIGRWLGWQIVKKYMEEHPEITLNGLMKEKDALKIFKQSKYKPKM